MTVDSQANALLRAYEQAKKRIADLEAERNDLADALRHIEQTALGEADDALAKFARAALDRHTHQDTSVQP